MNTEKTYYKFWLSSVESLRLAPNKTRNLLDIYGDAESVYKANADEIRKIRGMTDRIVKDLDESKKNTDAYRLFLKNIIVGSRLIPKNKNRTEPSIHIREPQYL